MWKICKIRQIVKLRQVLQWWRTRGRAPPTAEVPAGHVAVCVGRSSRRFVVRAAHLNHPAFRELLLQAEEDHGFVHHGPLCLPCVDESLFIQTLRQISSSYASRFPAGDELCRSAGRGKNSWIADSHPLLHPYF
ncbi:Auxin-induced protein 10A5 [Apostasia shenzhenica]|uniref:Auxin-induced protein 10A5 n=1 Tax=Apostasia shenzhenica TaxID=1088818 RepID=A0A2H9ZWJ9_9ASPA|nr:Auxin-induced protein 10A5 [Apostasia shenzhenica]